MDNKAETQNFLACESNCIFALLMMTAGMMGAYTFNMRGGVFCNAQTANFVIMSIEIGKGEIMKGLYYLIPITAYFLGAFISEILPTPVKRLGFLRWDTYLIGFEAIALLIIGFVPLTVPHQYVQVAINFIASMQYNTFRQAQGIPMATTFCTNHLRQVGIAFAKVVRKHDAEAKHRGLTHICMITFFFVGGVVLTFSCKFLQEKAIWLALIPLGIILVKLLYADLFKEQGMMSQKPRGH